MKKTLSIGSGRVFAAAFQGSLLRRLALGLLLAWVLAAPFPWGSVLPGVTGTGKIIVGAFLVALLAFLAPDARPKLDGLRLPLAAFSGLALLAALQLAPLPAGVLSALSPASAEAWSGAGKVMEAFGKPAPAARVSLVPWETAHVGLFVLALAAVFLASTVLLDRRAPRRVFALTVILSGLVQVALALATDDRTTRLNGSFINPNNFAGYLEISLAFAFGLLWFRARTGLSAMAAATGADERADALARLIPRVASDVVLFGVLGAGIVLSQSRGGILAALGGSILLAALAWGFRRDAPHSRRVAVGLLAALVVAGTAFAIAGAGTVAFLRFFMPDASDLAGDYRVLIWKDSLRAFADSPWVGYGLGTFREAIRRVQSPEVVGLVDQAHDEYLQILVTGGLAGALLCLAALVTGLRAFLRALAEQRHREESALGLAGLGGLVLLLLHGVAEFNFSMPAIPATLASGLGCAWAALKWSRRDEPEDGVIPLESRRPRRSEPKEA